MKPENPASKQSHPRPPATEYAKGLFGFFGIRLNEEPRYSVLLKDGPIEIRKYQRYRLATVTVDGPYERAVETAFHALADYIFGENREHEQLSMTAPVFQEEELKGWKLSFVLPTELPVMGAPHPVDPRIEFQEVPSETVAVISYTGNNSEEKIREMSRKLDRWLDGDLGYQASGSRRCAQYDAPFTIPFLKRNEIHVPVVDERGLADEGETRH